LFSVPPVEVAAAILPLRSSATAPPYRGKSKARTSRPMARSFLLILAQTLYFARDHQFFVSAEFNTMLGGEFFRTVRNKINVRTFAQDLPCRSHWIAQALDAPHASGPERSAVHDQRIQLHTAVAVEKTSPPRVEGFVVLHNDNGFSTASRAGPPCCSTCQPAASAFLTPCR